jgi:hypothetical protein
MFQLLQPIWLLAAAGISLPLLIHFWNVKQRKTLKIGSIILLKAGSQKNSRSLKLRDLLLLLLRCLIIIFTAILLAEPIWMTTTAAVKGKGWILIEKQNRSETYRAFRSRIDSLINAGYELHDFNPGFGKVANPREALLNSEEVTKAGVSYWSLLTALEGRSVPGQKMFLFTPNRLNRLKGRRPKITMDLQWETYPVVNSVEWISEAHLTGTNKIRLTRSSGDQKSTTHISEVIPASGTPEVGTSFQDGRLMVFLKADSSAELIPVDTLPTRITVYADRLSNDAKYIQAALEAIRSYSGRNLRITYTRNVSTVPKDGDWVFWLSESPLPASIKTKNRFIYMTGKQQTRPSILRTGTGISLGPDPLPLFRTVKYPSITDARALWRDGFGNPVLAVKTIGGSTDHFFFSRFDPAWNGLVWSSEFPAILYQILFPESFKPLQAKDFRGAPQLLPEVKVPAISTGTAEKPLQRAVDKPFWLLVFILFSAERLMVWRTERRSDV